MVCGGASLGQEPAKEVAMRAVNAQGLVVVLLAVVTPGLMIATLVLGLSGAAGATTWTGTIGVVMLAAWTVAINVRGRSRRRPVVPTPSTESARL
jgi:hypothetical protein